MQKYENIYIDEALLKQEMGFGIEMKELFI